MKGLSSLNPMLSRYAVPDMPEAEELLPYLRRIDNERWYSNFGPLVTEFEQKLIRHLNTRDNNGGQYISLITTASCYHALEIGLKLMRLPENAKVLIPAVTFPACPLAIRHAGATPVLADVDDLNWHLTPQIARRIASKMEIHAVMPVSAYGVPVSATAWDAFTDETGIPVIIDAASAFESQAIPKKGFVAHSLHATKPFSIGEGGLLVCRDRALMEEAQRMTNFGMRERITMTDGGNAKMSEYQGAVGLAQLERWERIKQRRREAFTFYRSVIEGAGLDLTFQEDIDEAIVSAVMLQSPVVAAPLVKTLNECGILAHRMYLPPLYEHPHFAGLERADHLPNSHVMERHVFGVPFHTFMDEEDMALVVAALAEMLEAARVPVRAI
ncbi:MAG TPA: DegT/DnrJ/EryC1/StrS family aminotransferase [Alphaproteobacteria bacterium]|nr:DegT/DnrJ/EryC1/StrS family aminotransferase [Alphaproteobacteria bacterium]